MHFLSRVARVYAVNLRNILLQLHWVWTRIHVDHGCIFHGVHRQRLQGIPVLSTGLLKLPLPWALLPSRPRRHTCVRRLGMHEIPVLRNRRWDVPSIVFPSCYFVVLLLVSAEYVFNCWTLANGHQPGFSSVYKVPITEFCCLSLLMWSERPQSNTARVMNARTTTAWSTTVRAESAAAVDVTHDGAAKRTVRRRSVT